MVETAGTRSLRALEIIEAVARARRPMAVSELTEALDLPRPTAHRLITLLIEEGFLLRQIGSRKLVVGPHMLRIGMSAMTQEDDRGARRAILQEVADETGETVNLSMPDGDKMVYVERVETDWPLRLQFAIGSRVPLHCTAAGKLYLSQLSQHARKSLIRAMPLKRHTPNTITDPIALEAAVTAISKTRFGLDDEELLQGMVAAAVPITDSAGTMIAAVAVQAPVARFAMNDLRQFEPLLRKASIRLAGVLLPEERETASKAAG